MGAARFVVAIALVGCAGKTPPPNSAADSSHPAPLYVLPAADPNQSATPATPAAPPAPAPPPEEARIAEPQPFVNSVFAGDLAMLPVDSELVVGFNVAKLKLSPLWSGLASMFAAKLSAIPDLYMLCGFDPTASLMTVTMGMKGLQGTPEATVVVHGISTAKLTACAPALKKVLAKSGKTLAADQDTFKVTSKDGTTATFGAIDGSTLLVLLGPNASKPSWDATKKGTSVLTSSTAFMEMLRTISPSDAIVGLVNGSVLTKAASMGVKMKALFGSADLSEVLTLDFRMRLQTADEALQLTQMAQGQINSPQVKQMFQRLDITAAGADVKVGITMDATNLKMIVGMIGGMTP
jgi:hypothetical protein